ncbi:MAG: DUF917 family protein [Oscillospiraceae bacterium]|nr:DUF917 family protein [Oscillospiraceae bacterium]
MKLTREIGEQILLGGWFLGGGGGGLPAGGKEVLDMVLRTGEVEFVSIDTFGDDDVLVTGSLVGSPASKESCVLEHHYSNTYKAFCAQYDKPIAAFVTNEAGVHSITNGWMLAALTGKPMVDAACNGRAHPTGVMGSMGLHAEPGYRSLQVCAGGRGEKEIELNVTGTVDSASQAVRTASILAGGMVTVIRNPVTAKYFRENGAIGCVTQAMEVGRRWMQDMHSLDALLDGLGETLASRTLGVGKITALGLEIKGGFDVGTVAVDCGTPLEVTFMNEYMTAECGGVRAATFPDLIMTIDAATRLPICSAQLEEGMEIAVVAVPREKLKLGRGMRMPELFVPCENATGKEMRKYVFGAL